MPGTVLNILQLSWSCPITTQWNHDYQHYLLFKLINFILILHILVITNIVTHILKTALVSQQNWEKDTRISLMLPKLTRAQPCLPSTSPTRVNSHRHCYHRKLLSSFHRWGNWGIKNMPKFTVNGRAEMQTQEAVSLGILNHSTLEPL